MPTSSPFAEAAPVSPTQAIRDLESERQGLLPLIKSLPDIQELEHRIAVLGAQCQVNLNLKGELKDAIEHLDRVRKATARNNDIKFQIVHLEQAKSQLEAEERLRKIDNANKRMLEMKAEFNATAKSLCRLYEQMHRQNRIYQNSVPGFNPMRLPEFNFPFMLPMGWNGVTSDLIKQNSLPWLNKEKPEAA